MDTKKIIVDIDIKAEDIKTATEAMNKSSKASAEYTKTLNDLKTQQKENNALYKIGAIDATENAKRQSELKLKMTEVSKSLRATNKEYALNKTVIDAAKGSNDQMKARLSLLTKELNGMSKAEAKTTTRGKELQATVLTLTEKLKANEKAVGDNRRNVGNYESALKGVAGKINVMGVNLGNVASQLQTYKDGVVAGAAATKASSVATGGLSGALQVLKVALISTGVGAIVVALGSMVTFLTQTKRGSEFLAQAMSALGATLSVVTDRASALGEGIINAFKNPKQALKDLGGLIKSQIVNRFTAIPALLQAAGKAFQALANRDIKGIKEAAKEAGQAVIQLNTGLDPEQQKKIANGIKGVANEIGNEAKEAANLEKRMQNLRDAERELLVETSKRKAEVAELQLIAEDETNTYKERAAAIQKANSIQEKNMASELALQKERVAIVEAQLALGENLEEDEQKLAEERAKLGDIEAANIKKLRTLKAKENSIRKQSHAEQVKEANEIRKLSEEQVKQEEAEAEKRAEIREEFRREQLSEIEKRKEDAYNRANELRVAGEEEIEIERYLGQQLIEIHREEQDAILNGKLQHFEDEAQAAKRKINTEIEDEQIRAASILQINRDLALAKQQELDLEIQNYTASTGALGYVDEERNALLIQRKAEVDEQLVEIDRQTNEVLKQHSDELASQRQSNDQKALAAATGGLNAIGNIIGNLSKMMSDNIKQTEEQAKAAGKTDAEISKMTEKSRKKAHGLAVAAAVVQTLQAGIAAYQSGASVPVIGVALGPIMAAAALAFGFANVSKMKQQKMAKGGVLQGATHGQGGIPVSVRGGGEVEAEHNEIILTKGVYENPKLRAEASRLNVEAGGRPLVPTNYAAAGGIVSTNPSTFAARQATTNSNAVLESRMAELGDRIQNMTIVTKVSDINRVQGNVARVSGNDGLR